MLYLILKEGKGFDWMRLSVRTLQYLSSCFAKFPQYWKKKEIIQYIKTSFPGVDSIQAPKISILSNESESIELLEH